MDTEDPELRSALEDVDWSGAAKAAAVGSDDLGSRVEKLAKLWDAKHEGEMGSLDLSAPKPVEEIHAAATGDDKPHAEQEADKPSRPPPEPPTEPWARIQYELNQNDTRAQAADPLAEKMKSVGWAPPEAAKSPDWSKLENDLRAAEGNAGLQRSLQQWSQAVAPGLKANMNAGQEEIAAAKAPLEVAQERQHFEAQQQANTAKLLAQHKEQTRLDPNSPESERARAALRPVFEMAGNVPEGFEKWSAADVEQHSKLLTPIAGQLTQERIAKGREAASTAEKKAAQDAKDAAEKGNKEQEATSLKAEVGLIAADPRAAKLGWTPDKLAGLDRKGIEGVRHEMESMPKEKPHGTGPAIHVKPGDYSTVPEDDRETVKAIVEGRAKAPDPGSRYGMKILNLVTAIDPKFDATRFGAYKDVVEHQASDKDIVAAETAQRHIQQARSNIPDNFDSQFMNKIRQAVLTGTGSPEMTPFQTEVKVAADEYARGLGNNAQSGREEVEHILEPVQSKAQLIAALDTIDHLLATKQQTWKDQLAKVAPRGAPDTVTLVAKDGRKKSVKRDVAEKFLKEHPGAASIQ